MDTEFKWDDDLVFEYANTVLNDYAAKRSPMSISNFIRLKRTIGKSSSLNYLLSIDEVIDEIRRHCDGTFSIDPQDWDLPRKASEIIEPLIKRASESSTAIISLHQKTKQS